MSGSESVHGIQWQRPPEGKDHLADSNEQSSFVQHPKDRKRVRNQPRVFSGPIASADNLLKNPIKRDALRDKFGVKAVEMEGSGIADATWLVGTGYLVVRGICDYCDEHKNDEWQYYSAIAAAAYTKALIESMPAVCEQLTTTKLPTESAISPTPMGGPPDTTDSRLVRFLAVRHACSDPLPVEIFAKTFGYSAAELEQAFEAEISAGKITSAGNSWSSPRSSVTVTDDDARFMATVLGYLLDYIDRHEDCPQGRSQVDNAVELATQCKSFCPEVVAKSFGVLQSLLKRRGDKKLVLRVADLVIEAARSVKSRSNEVVQAEALALICGKAWVYQRVERFEEARSCALESLKLGEQIHWKRNTAFCKKCMGRLSRLQAEHTSAIRERHTLLNNSITSLKEAITLFEDLDYPKREAEIGDCYSLLGRTHLVYGQLEQANWAASQATTRLDDNTNKDFLDLQILRGDLRAASNEHEAAILYYSSVIDQHDDDDCEKTDMRARALYARGLCRKAQRRPQLAVADFKEAAQIWDELDDNHAAATAKWQILRLETSIPQSLLNALNAKPMLLRVTALNLYIERQRGRSRQTLSNRDQPTDKEIRRLIEKAEEKSAQDNPNW